MSNRDYERIRTELAKKYKAKIDDLQTQNKKLREENEKLKSQNVELESKVNEQTEWIERLLEYTELTPEEVKEEVRKTRTIHEIQGVCEWMDKVLFRNYYK